jgi:hypothetical protein
VVIVENKRERQIADTVIGRGDDELYYKALQKSGSSLGAEQIVMAVMQALCG